jgi:sugar phosphate isomerase/epimerase
MTEQRNHPEKEDCHHPYLEVDWSHTTMEGAAVEGEMTCQNCERIFAFQAKDRRDT